MIKVQVKVTVPNLDRMPTDVPCPLCDLETPTTMGAIRIGKTIICRGCHSNIELVDHMAGFHRFKKRFAAMLKSLER